LNRPKKPGQLLLVADRKKDAQNPRVIITKDDGALVGQFNFVKFPKMIPNDS
jgi:hypothetical protein